MALTPSMQIFRLACDELGILLKPYGFKYTWSKRSARRQGVLFEHFVTFGTSRSINSLPGHVHLEVRAGAWSTALADYRSQAGITLSINEAVLFATTIENIFKPAPPYVRYDIGDPKRRREVMNTIIRVLKTDVLGAFDLVESPSALRAALDAESIPCLSDENIRDYFKCFPVAGE
jgi:hypothetical protein